MSWQTGSSLNTTDAISQADFFTPFQRGVARWRQEAGRPFRGGLVQVQDATQLPWPQPLTCGGAATQCAISEWQGVKDRNNVTLRKMIRPLLKVTLSCRSRSRLTRTHWGADLDSTDRWSIETCKETRLRLWLYYISSSSFECDLCLF